MTSTLAHLAALAPSQAKRALPMSPILYFLIAFALFVVLLGVTWSFRGAANKVRGGENRHPGGHH